MAEDNLTATRLRQLFHYESDTGIFTRREVVGRKMRVGQVAGTVTQGRVHMGIEKRQYQAHRLAWLYMTGEWPKYFIDHIDGNPLNNVFSNLRDVTNQTNSQNQKKPTKKNKSGFLGVSYCNCTGRWRAAIRHSGRQVQLGRFKTPEEAHEVYVAAKRIFHEGCTI